MANILERIIPEFELFLLVFMRVSGLFLIVPIFGTRNVPVIFRIGLALFVSYLIIGFQALPVNVRLDTYTQLAFYALTELIIGFVLGFVALLAFSAISMAGQLIDTHLGFGLVHMLDPQSGMEVTLMGKFKNILAIIIFFTIDGHHKLISIVAGSFNYVPAGNVRIDTVITLGMIELFVNYFVLALTIAIPIIAASIIVEMVFGIIVRTVPQMNIFVLGIPIKIVIGLIALYLLIPVYVAFMGDMFGNMLDTMYNLIRKMALP
jgi:flagellar biosynthetic protein FliR